MNKREYLENILKDAQEWIDDNYEYYDSFDNAWDDMQMTISGNDNGSYYCNSARAQEAVQGVFWDPDVIYMLQMYGYDNISIFENAETFDVLIRLMLIDELYSEIKEYWDEKDC